MTPPPPGRKREPRAALDRLLCRLAASNRRAETERAERRARAAQAASARRMLAE